MEKEHLILLPSKSSAKFGTADEVTLLDLTQLLTQLKHAAMGVFRSMNCDEISALPFTQNILAEPFTGRDNDLL